MSHFNRLWWLLVLCLGFLSPIWAQQALFVTGPGAGNLQAGDQALLNRFQTLGYTVTVKGGTDTAVTADAIGMDFVFISASVNQNVVDTAFRSVTVPVIVTESRLFGRMGMTGNLNGTDYGLATGVDQLEILDPSSPFVQPYTDTITVTLASTFLNWGNPPPTANRVARIVGSPTQYAIFSYDTGDQMVGLTAPGPRVGFFYFTGTASHVTQAGFDLLDNVIQSVAVSTCNAAAGTIKVDQDSFLLGGSAVITATPQGDAVIPPGFTQVYVLTTGNSLVIQQVDTIPQFTVSATGTYGVHSIIVSLDPSSPDFFDLNSITLGTTTLVNVLIQINGSGICADVDLAGDDAVVVACTADAGTLTIDQDPVTLVGSSVTVSATPDGNINVPAGYSVLYVLTSGSGLVIEQVNTTASFDVTQAGDYTIHTLVFDGDSTSPNFLDLSVVVPGTTTGVDVLNLINANGICASLDVPGGTRNRRSLYG